MIDFRMLGALSLTTGDGREVRSLLTQPRRLALLAYLAAATPRGLHRRDKLLALFWPDLDQEHARAALRQALHVLRSALGVDVVASRGDEEIGLDFERIRGDVAEFERAIESGRLAAGLELYRGDLLEGFFISEAPEFERWLEQERSRLREVSGHAARALLEQAEAGGDLAQAASWARRAVRLSPLDDPLVRRLITLLDRLGDRAGAVHAYEDFAERLARELEVEPAAETKMLIEAVRARETASPAELAPSAAVDSGSRTGVPAAAAAPRGRRALWLAVIAVAAVALVLGATVGDWRDRLWSRASPVRSLAVLPLQNLSGDSSQAWFSDGMTEALITDLGRISALRVTSRAAVLQFEENGTPLRNVVSTLHVDAVVEGAVQRSGDRVRVDLRLIDGASGYQLWSDRFEEDAQNRFALEDRVSRGIVSALRLRLTPAEERALLMPPTDNLEAYELYLRGKLRIRRIRPQEIAAAIEVFERAVALDPDFAAAQAELAHAYGQMVFALAPRDTQAVERALLAAEKALRLNPNLAEAHYARGYLLWGPFNRFAHVQAIQEYRRALTLNPNLETAHHQLGLIYLHIGLLDDAIEELRKALVIDPTDRFAEQRIGVALVHQGKYAEALAIFERIPSDINPSLWHYHVAWALLHLDRDEEASALIERYLREHPEDRGGLLTSARAFLRAKSGDPRGAEEDIGKAEDIGKGFIHFHHTASRIAAAYALLHQPGPAVQWLRRAAEDGLPCYPCFAKDPDLDNIRSDPAFIVFMRELKTRWEGYRRLL